jgi:hypothetical protein
MFVYLKPHLVLRIFAGKVLDVTCDAAIAR